MRRLQISTGSFEGLKEYRNHAEACRSRIVKDMEETEDGSQRRKEEEKRCMPETTEESGVGDVERHGAVQDEMNENSDKIQEALPQVKEPEHSEKEKKDHDEETAKRKTEEPKVEQLKKPRVQIDKQDSSISPPSSSLKRDAEDEESDGKTL